MSDAPERILVFIDSKHYIETDINSSEAGDYGLLTTK